MNKEERIKAAEAYAKKCDTLNQTLEKQADIRQGFLAGAEAEAESKWKPISELDLSIPKVVLRWHKMWKCVISVWYSNADPMFRWHEKTLTTKWPEEAFEPFYMDELPQPPLNQQ